MNKGAMDNLLFSAHNMECPFTWTLNPKEYCDFPEHENVPNYEETSEETSVQCFIRMNTIAYIECMQGKYVAAEQLIEEINNDWNNICKNVSEKNGYSVAVLLHIKVATAFCVYSIVGKKDQAKTTESQIADAKNFNSDIEKGTIFGSRAIASTVCNKSNVDTSIQLAKLAVSYYPNCALWHYVIANCLRNKRRYTNFCSIVSEEEKNEFLKCYELSQSGDFGIYVARMFKESRNWEKSSEIFNEIYHSENTNTRIRLNLALHFINRKDFGKAKNCLDCVINSIPPEIKFKRYYHYLAKYNEKRKNYHKAKENYLIAISEGNFPADIDYLNFIRNNSNSMYAYDTIKHLKTITFLFEKKNFKLAADYFLKALKTNHCDPQLEKFQPKIVRKQEYNIYELISKNLLTVNEHNYGNTLKELKNYCIDYNKRMEKNNVPDSLDTKFSGELSLEK